MALDWYPFFVVDYRRDTYQLTLEEDGAYRRLIDEYMLTREPLPNDDAALARIIGIPTTEWRRLAPVVRRFFRMKNDKLWHKRCEQELRAQNARHNRYSDRAKKAAFTRWSKTNGLHAKLMRHDATLQNISKITPTESGDRGLSENKHTVSNELAATIKEKWFKG